MDIKLTNTFKKLNEDYVLKNVYIKNMTCNGKYITIETSINNIEIIVSVLTYRNKTSVYCIDIVNNLKVFTSFKLPYHFDSLVEIIKSITLF